MQDHCFRFRRLALGFVFLTLSVSCERDEVDAARELPRTTPPAATAESRPSEADATHDRWNLVLITMDTTRTDALGAYGQPLDVTPNIDRMAAEGVVFEQVSAPSSTTLPAHSTIFTGKFPFAHGARSNFGYVLSRRNRTLAEVLADAGYRTGAEIAAAVLRKKSQIAQGYQSIHDTRSAGVELRPVLRSSDSNRAEDSIRVGSIRVGQDISNRGIEFIRQNRDSLFHLWLHYFEPHLPRPPFNEFRTKFPDSEYLAEVASMDAQVGRVIEEIRRLGLREKTLVVVTADHGEGLGDHGETTHGYFVYQSTVRVPWILWGPSALPAGRRVGGVVRTADIAPTVLDLMGMPPLNEIQGVSVRGAVMGQQADPRLVGYGESVELYRVFGTTPLRYVREGRWKYVHKVEPELFDLVADPGEENNSADRRPEVVRRLKARLRALLESAPRVELDSEIEVDAQTRSELIALGYATPAVAHHLDDELQSLELVGEDALDKMQDATALSRAQGYVTAENYARAIDELDELLERNPDSVYIQSLLARSLNGAGRTEPAKAAMRRVLELDGCADDTRRELNEILHAQKRYAERIAMLAESPEGCPDYAVHRNNLAWALATVPDDDLRDGARALGVIREAIALQADDPNPEFLDTLAAAHAESSEFDEAVKVASDALRILQGQNVDAEVIAVYRAHLRAFEAGQPIREP